ncbi:MAG: leucine-rich repeat domain-containing protein [Clostridia bacterium]|nr:leucine-rich repeat domain-containing protein [Clostridia bacterium]
MILKLSNKKGVKLKTYKKYCNEDIEILPILKTKQIIKNGEFIPPEGYIGFDRVKVNVSYQDDEIKGDGEYWVRFVDFKGNIISQLRANTGTFVPFPTPPEIEGYTFEGWTSNMPIENGGITVNENNVYCGALYVTSDGKTRVHLNITDEDMLTLQFCYFQDTANGVQVDFGDGSEPYTSSSVGAQTIEHTFFQVGEYIVTFDFSQNVLGYLGTNTSASGILGDINSSHLDYQKLITKIEYGRGIVFASAYSCAHAVNLEQVNIPSGVTVESNSFYGCSKLKCLVIPITASTNCKKNICTSCHSLEHLVLPNNFTKISGYLADSAINLKMVALPYALTEIGEYSFDNCISLSEIVFPNSITTLGNYSFNGCERLANIVWPTKINSIGNYAFSDCCSLLYIYLYDNLKTIGEYAFKNCKKVCEIIIPKNVKSVGEYAFSSMISLTKAIFECEKVQIFDNAFKDCYNLVDVYLPNNLYNFGDILVNNRYLKQVAIPSTVLSVSERFSGMKCLSEVDMTRVKKPPILNEQTYFDYGTDSAVQISVTGEQIYHYKNADVWKNNGVIEKIVCKTSGFENAGERTFLVNENHIIKLSYGVSNAQVPQFSVQSSNAQIVKINSFSAQNNLLSINLSSLSTVGECNISVVMTVGSERYEQVFKVAVLNSAPECLTEIVDLNTGYNFALDSNGYYKSTNGGIANSVCMSKIVFKSNYLNFYDIYAECYNSAQKNYDYGTISKLNLPLCVNAELDEPIITAKCFKEIDVETKLINLGKFENMGDCVYLKYVKNGTLNLNDDIFKVKFTFVRNTETLV